MSEYDLQYIPPEARSENNEVESLKREVQIHFPTYNRIDRTTWDNPPSPESGLHRVLGFSEGDGAETDPALRFLFYTPNEFSINLRNNPLGNGSETHIASPAPTVRRSMFRGSGGLWQPGELPTAVETAKMFHDGIPLTPGVVDAPAFIMADGHTATLREVLQAAQEIKAAPKSQKFNRSEAFRERSIPQNIYELLEKVPTAAERLIVERLEYQASNNLTVAQGGKTYDARTLLREIERGTDLGKRTRLLQATQTGVFAELLWEGAFIRSGASLPIRLPE